MVKRRIILVLVVCFSIAVFTGRTLSQARSSNRTVKPPDRKRLEGMTQAEWKKENLFKAFVRPHIKGIRDPNNDKVFLYMRLEKERTEYYWKSKEREAWKQLLRVTERQWELIEPKLEKVYALGCEMYVGAGWEFLETRNDQRFHWNRYSKNSSGMKLKALDELTEGERIVEEIIDLLENENTKEPEFRQKIDVLLDAREKAAKQLPKARQELAEVLTTPRQRAIFLLLRYID